MMSYNFNRRAVNFDYVTLSKYEDENNFKK